MSRWVLVLGIAASLAATMVVLRQRSVSGAGPLDAGGLGYSQPLGVGEIFSVALIFLQNEGRKPAVVERVRLLGVTGPLDFLGVRTRPVPDERGRGMIVGEYGFPPLAYAAEPLAEKNVVPVPKTFTEDGSPAEGLQLLIGVRTTEPGVAAYRAVEVSYRVGKRRYREIYESPVHLCAPAEDFIGTAEGCPPRELEDVFDDRVLG